MYEVDVVRDVKGKPAAFRPIGDLVWCRTNFIMLHITNLQKASRFFFIQAFYVYSRLVKVARTTSQTSLQTHVRSAV